MVQGPDLRIGALRRFAVAITVVNVVGYNFLGFEYGILTPFAGLAAAYSAELLLELVRAWSTGTRPKFLGTPVDFINFLLPAHIGGLAVSMLIFANNHVGPTVFAAFVAVGSKYIFRVRYPDGSVRHVLNPSNFGIAMSLLAFPWVAVTPAHQFSAYLPPAGDVALPLLIVLIGSFLNTRFTQKMGVILGWLGGWVLQAAARSYFYGANFDSILMTSTGIAFVIFTFYMISDPATTPKSGKNQFFFGLSVASVYGILMVNHVIYALFYSLVLCCAVRGAYIAALSWSLERAGAKQVDLPGPPGRGLVSEIRTRLAS